MRIKLFLLAGVFLFLPLSASAGLINIGVLSFISGPTGNGFTVDNFTGPSSGVGCSVDFASCTPVTFQSLNLLLTRANGSQFNVAASGTLDAGDAALQLAGFPVSDIFSSARLTGKISKSVLTLVDTASTTVNSQIDITLNPSGGRATLAPNTDIAVISVSQVVPEPPSVAFFVVGLAVLFRWIRANSNYPI